MQDSFKDFEEKIVWLRRNYEADFSQIMHFLKSIPREQSEKLKEKKLMCMES